jgi:hypothetical protein
LLVNYGDVRTVCLLLERSISGQKLFPGLGLVPMLSMDVVSILEGIIVIFVFQ